MEMAHSSPILFIPSDRQSRSQSFPSGGILSFSVVFVFVCLAGLYFLAFITFGDVFLPVLR